ncbi:peptide ABC transporter ATP-binding protein [Candidatus Heimdallarchaeota archaeon B3_Heim]|nr:MAG: peptide ABC transporter ATP-binding protein [Candidatus Heimdallarchaeota archaeon B3_Heim]
MIESKDTVLELRDIRVHFFTYDGVVKALDGITFDVYKGESLGLVGETGCGKSVTVRSIMRLIEDPGKIVNGTIMYRDKDILQMDEEDVRKLRGKKIAMIFQDPMTFLNPLMTVGEQVAEVILLHQGLPGLTDAEKDKVKKAEMKQILKEEVTKVFELVRLPDAAGLYSRYPHELSGGMRQRVMIAMAIASKPDVMIADEATTALDVTIQAQILKLLQNLKDDLTTTLIFVTHNLGIIAEMCDRVAIFYGGQVVEVASTMVAFKDPIHPYTKGLLKAIPLLHAPKEKLDSIPGVVPNLVNPPGGCRFNPRCYLAEKNLDVKENLCTVTKPKLLELRPNHFVACHVREKEYKHI